MTSKRIKLPKEANVGPEEAARHLIDNGDVEGHGLPTTAPPSLMRKGGGHGGEFVRSNQDGFVRNNQEADEESDVEGHRKE